MNRASSSAKKQGEMIKPVTEGGGDGPSSHLQSTQAFPLEWDVFTQMFKRGAAQVVGETNSQLPRESPSRRRQGSLLNCREAPWQQWPKAGDEGGGQVRLTSLFEKSLGKFERLNDKKNE